MAMMRRFRRGGFRRRFSRPVRRERPVWSTTNFNETAMAVDSTLNVQVLWDPLTNEPSNSPGSSQHWSIRRIIVNGGMAIVPQQTALTNDIVTVFGALICSDSDDDDATLITTSQGQILEGGSNRLLWTNCWTFVITEVAAAVYSTAYIPAPVQINIDLKTRVNMKFDDSLMLLLQFGSTAASVINAAAFSAITRILMVKDQ